MKRTGIIASFMVLCSFLTATAQEDVKVLEMSLQQCIDYALKNNQNLKNTALERDIAKATVRETIGLGLPQVNFGGGVNYNFEVQESLFDPATFGGGGGADSTAGTGGEGEEVPIAFGREYDANFAISLRQLIFDGSYFVGLRAAKAYQELSSKDYIKSKVDLVEAVSKAYYNVLITGYRTDLMNQNFARLDTLLRQTKALKASGYADDSDFAQIQIQYNKLKVENEKLNRLRSLSSKLLKFQMGMDLGAEIKLLDEFSDASGIGLIAPDDKNSFDYHKRIEYSQLQTNQALAELDMKNNRVQRLPKLYLAFNYGANTATSSFGNIFTPNRWYSFGTVGVTFEVPIFDGGMKKQKIQKNKIQVEQIQNSKSFLEQSIDLEIEESSINLESAVKMLSAEEDNLELTETVFRATSLEYKEGVGSSRELVDAETELKQAQTNYFNALFDVITYKIDLQKALGTLYHE